MFTRDSLNADAHRIEPCERRLALSASLAGDLMLDALGGTVLGGTNLGGTGDDLDLQHNVPVPPPAELHDDTDTGVADFDTTDLRGAGQTVVVIDSGIAWDHLAFASPNGGTGFGPGYRVVGGWDFAEDDADPYDDGPTGFHGTHVAGTLAGKTNDFTGVASDADIVALRVFDDHGNSQLQWIESALQWVHANRNAFDSPITTVNLSVGAALSDANQAIAMQMLEDEFSLLRQDNILVFAAAGNFFDGGDGNTGLLYPASSDSVVPVSSIDGNGELNEFAQRQSDIFAASGRSVSSSVPDHVFGWDGRVDDFAALDGTSMASPQIAGASMLVRQAMIDEGLSPTADNILARMRDTSIEHTDPTTGQTYRTLDLAAALVGQPATQATIDHFDGSVESEHVQLDLRDGIVMRVGEKTYFIDPAHDGAIVIDVGGGYDSLSILGSDAAERLILNPSGDEVGSSTGSLSTNAFTIQLRGFEKVAFEGGGGPDRASLFDSTSSDHLDSRPGLATLKGVGFEYTVTGVPKVYVHATAGGNDVAFLNDSSGDDSLSVRPQFTSLRSDDSFQLAYGFERVYAYATSGGNDIAEIYDSAGDDTMSISSGRSIITGPGYHVSASGFESTIGYATGGGNDIARIYADETSSNWDVATDRVQWTGQDAAVRIARGFERTEAFEQFEPIELIPLSTGVASTPWWVEDPKIRAERDAEASRSLFAALGEE
ncbi:Intracellular serine protease [Rubripirellula tenax]|uniref:Intracellular serine protease n=1 Tax=Rubripirellula tenax TaxID=2528015 RepID=A0A5C6FAV1_9BACT|nr:S8 family serine peptidase [Rubripirellula tenax]TWU58933.1 Intracellular serine protease [Rubripirellula tenax]